MPLEREKMRVRRAEILLSMEHIGKSFSGVQVLDDVHFDLREGEVHVLAGENGAGKTTLIKILSGVHREYEGEIFLEGKTARFKSPHDAALKGISVIHQEMSVVNSMAVLDNIFLGREITRHSLWMDFRSEKRRARELLSQFGIDIDLKATLSSSSLSVRQIVEIVKALVYEARIIIMDEPTSALSGSEVLRLFEIIRQLKKKGCGVVYISHRLEEIFRIADRITVLRDGRNVGTSESQKLTTEELVRRMVGRELNQQFPERSSYPGKEILVLKNVTLPDPSRAKRSAVEDISLSLREGEILGIAGLRGSGKSELLHGIFDSSREKVKGTVSLSGKPVQVRSPRKSIKEGLVLQPSDRKRLGLVAGMSIRRNISLPSLVSFSSFGWIRAGREKQIASRQMKAFQIKASSPDQEVRTLSGGNQQKVVLAKWLETRPKVLLLDEPTLGIDVGAKHEIYSLMNELTSRGLSILLITSELPELLAMSDRILVMYRGRIQAEFSREEATQEKVIQAAMGERVSL